MLFTGGRVLVGDPRDGRFEYANVRVRDGVVVEIDLDLDLDLDLDVEGESVQDLSGRWLLPGFVDVHHHAWHSSVRASLVDTLAPASREVLDDVAQRLDSDDLRATTLGAALAQLDAGVTTALDHVEIDLDADRARAALAGFIASGVRGWWCTNIHNVGDDVASWAGAVATKTDGRAHLALAVDSDGPRGIGEQLSLASEHGALAVLRADPRSGPGVNLGLLLDADVVGPGQLYLSCSTTPAHVLDQAVDAGAAFACSPDLEMAWGEGYPVLKRLVDQGGSVGLGSGSPSVVGSDSFGTMRMGLESERGRYQQLAAERQGTSGIPGIAMRCADVLHAATLGGATALGLGDVCGSIEVGKAADLVVADPRTPRLTPVVDPVVAIVLHLTVAEITDVLVGGRFAKRSGRLVHPDLSALLEQLSAVTERVGLAQAAAGSSAPTTARGSA